MTYQFHHGNNIAPVTRAVATAHAGPRVTSQWQRRRVNVVMNVNTTLTSEAQALARQRIASAELQIAFPC